MYFVTYHGNLEKDPLDKGVEQFVQWRYAKDFADTMVNKGLTVKVWRGERTHPTEEWAHELRDRL